MHKQAQLNAHTHTHMHMQVHTHTNTHTHTHILGEVKNPDFQRPHPYPQVMNLYSAPC